MKIKALLLSAFLFALAGPACSQTMPGGGGPGGTGCNTSGTAILKGNGSGGCSNATSGTDYAPATSGSAILKGSGLGGFSNATSGTDYAPATSGTAILKGSGAGGFSNAVVGTDYGPPGQVNVVNGSNPTTVASNWLAFVQYTVIGSGRTITLPASSGLSASGGMTVDTNGASVTVTATSPDTITFDGSTTGAGGSVTLPQGALYFASTDASGHIYISDAVSRQVGQTFTGEQRDSWTTLTISTATFTPNNANNNYKIVLVHASCPCTLANPSTITPGAAGLIEVDQSATGSDHIGTYGSAWIAPGGTASITLSTGANARDFFSYKVLADSTVLITPILNASH